MQREDAICKVGRKARLEIDQRGTLTFNFQCPEPWGHKLLLFEGRPWYFVKQPELSLLCHGSKLAGKSGTIQSLHQKRCNWNQNPCTETAVLGMLQNSLVMVTSDRRWLRKWTTSDSNSGTYLCPIRFFCRDKEHSGQDGPSWLELIN